MMRAGDCGNSLSDSGCSGTAGPGAGCASAAAGAEISGTAIISVTREPVRRAEAVLIRTDSEPQPGPAAGGGARRRMAPETGQRPEAARRSRRTTVTGPDGSFRFEGVPDGADLVHVWSVGMMAGGRDRGRSCNRQVSFAAARFSAFANLC